MKAKEISEKIDKFFEKIVPQVLVITRSGGGSYNVYDNNAGKDVGTYATFDALKDFLLEMRAWDIPEEKLQGSDVNVEIPVDSVALQYAESLQVDEGADKCPECGSDNIEDLGDGEYKCKDCGDEWEDKGQDED